MPDSRYLGPVYRCGDAFCAGYVESDADQPTMAELRREEETRKTMAPASCVRCKIANLYGPPTCSSCKPALCPQH